MNPEISITIPIYNEEEGIETTVNNLVEALERYKINYELVLVNHGSWDKSKEVLEKLGKKNKRLSIFNLEKNLGYGGGIMYGFNNSQADYIGWVCADEETSAEDASKLIKYLQNNNYEVIKAARTKRTDGLFRIFTSFVFNSLVGLRFNLRVKDANGYPFFMKKTVFQSIQVKEKTHLFNLVLLRQIRKGKFSLREVPVVHGKRETGTTFMKPKRIIEMAFDLIKYSI